MPTEATPTPGAMWRRGAAVCEAAAVLAFLLLVLRDQYGVAWLQAYYQVTFDEWFVASVAGALVARALSRRSPAAGRMLVFRLVLLVVMTVASLVAAEYLARVQYRRARTSGNAGDYIGRSGAWSPGPSNGLGFREREIPAKTPGRYRIAVVGDSFTWGQGIEREERFSNLIEQFLGSRYEVFNFGIAGDNMPEHLTRLTQALDVSPNFVLLQIYINDFETREMQRPRSYPLLPPSLDNDLQGSSLLYGLIEGQWAHIQQMAGMSESYAHYMERSLRDPNAPNAREAYGQLHEFFDRARAPRACRPARCCFRRRTRSAPTGETIRLATCTTASSSCASMSKRRASICCRCSRPSPIPERFG